MLGVQPVRDKLRSTFVAIQKIAAELHFCRRVDMENFTATFSTALRRSEKNALPERHA
jgi:hypothetical protein